MTKHSSHRRWKGHCLMCATNRGKVKSAGDRLRTPWAVRRRLGVDRRFSRNKVASQ